MDTVDDKRSRKRYTASQKAEIVRELLTTKITAKAISEREGIHENQISRWKKEALANLGKTLGADREPVKKLHGKTRGSVSLLIKSLVDGVFERHFNELSGAILNTVLRNIRQDSIPVKKKEQIQASIKVMLKGSGNRGFVERRLAFIKKSSKDEKSEMDSYKAYFDELCELLGVDATTREGKRAIKSYRDVAYGEDSISDKTVYALIKHFCGQEGEEEDI